MSILMAAKESAENYNCFIAAMICLIIACGFGLTRKK